VEVLDCRILDTEDLAEDHYHMEAVLGMENFADSLLAEEGFHMVVDSCHSLVIVGGLARSLKAGVRLGSYLAGNWGLDNCFLANADGLDSWNFLDGARGSGIQSRE